LILDIYYVTIGYMLSKPLRDVSPYDTRRLCETIRALMQEMEFTKGSTAYRSETWRAAARVLSDIEHVTGECYSGMPNMVPPFIRFGTSTWTYEGWQGQVYHNKYKKDAFARECLSEYCQFLYKGVPLFRTVGNDSTFYRPPTAGQLTAYLDKIPTNFDMCCKVWEEITIPRFVNHPRYGTKAGQVNPRFLDAALFKEMVLAPYRVAKFEPHTGPFIFEFQRHGIPVEEFVGKLDTFFAQLPKDLQYAVEVRSGEILGPLYRDVLESHGVAHVYNHWSYMPPLAEQHRRMERFTAPFTVLRLLTPLNMSYEEAKKRAAPYTKIVAELPEMRREAVDLMLQGVNEARRVYALVNNRSEGNAPLTIQALAAHLSDAPR
jgi:uncharacterized protein YecE (DUF72 family)